MPDCTWLYIEHPSCSSVCVQVDAWFQAWKKRQQALTADSLSPLRLAQDICGTSDPYVEVYVNDVKQVRLWFRGVSQVILWGLAFQSDNQVAHRFCKNHGQVKFYHNLGGCMLSLIGNFTGWHELFNNPICTHLDNVYLMPWEYTARRSESNQTRLRSNWNLRPWWMTPIILKNLWLDWGDGVRVATCRAKVGMWTSPSIRSGTILIPGRNLQSQDVVLCRCFLVVFFCMVVSPITVHHGSIYE